MTAFIFTGATLC